MRLESEVQPSGDLLQGGILILTGPSGSGKTATVRVLCQELGFKVQEWTNPSNVEPYSSWQTGKVLLQRRTRERHYVTLYEVKSESHELNENNDLNKTNVKWKYIHFNLKKY